MKYNIYIYIIVALIIFLIIYIKYSPQAKINNFTQINTVAQCALLIPIHEKHFHYLYDLIPKIENIIPLYLIFSDEEQLNNFKMKDKVIPFIFSEKSSSIVTDKKFYGLKKLINSNHKYIIVCDAEIDIIPENFTMNNIIKKCSDIFNNKIIYGGEVDIKKIIINDIIDTSSSVFKNKNDIEKLRNIIRQNERLIYTWWSDLPVYQIDHLTDFFNKINTNNYNWNHFDNMIYNFYLLLYKDFKLINITKELGISNSLESYVPQNIDYINKLKDIKYSFSYISHTFFNKYKELMIKEKTLFIYHLDR